MVMAEVHTPLALLFLMALGAYCELNNTEAEQVEVSVK